MEKIKIAVVGLGAALQHFATAKIDLEKKGIELVEISDETINGLQGSLAEANLKIENCSAIIKDLEALKADHIEEIRQKNQEIENLNQDIADANELIEELSASNAAKEFAVAHGGKVITHAGKNYKFIGESVLCKLGRFSFDELKENEDVIEHLVDIKSGLLVELIEEEEE